VSILFREEECGRGGRKATTTTAAKPNVGNVALNRGGDKTVTRQTVCPRLSYLVIFGNAWNAVVEKEKNQQNAFRELGLVAVGVGVDGVGGVVVCGAGGSGLFIVPLAGGGLELAQGHQPMLTEEGGKRNVED
jgi:hypothetical protein